MMKIKRACLSCGDNEICDSFDRQGPFDFCGNCGSRNIGNLWDRFKQTTQPIAVLVSGCALAVSIFSLIVAINK